MPNDCWCDVRIGADTEHIQLLIDTEMSFEKLRPNPHEEDPDWYEWNMKFWGTKWDRMEYRLDTRGPKGIECRITTAWSPPLALFEHLVETYHDMWIRCDWSEEGGYAGIIVISWDKDMGKIKKVEEFWEDWCPEEWFMRMGKVE